MESIVFNNNYAQAGFRIISDYALTVTKPSSGHVKYITPYYLMVNSEFLDAVKAMNKWLLDVDNAKIVFDPDYRYKKDEDDDDEEEKAITKEQLLGFGILLDPSRFNSYYNNDDDKAKYLQIWEDKGLIEDLATHSDMMTRVRWLKLKSMKYSSKVDGSYLYSYTSTIPLNAKWKAEDDNPDDNQMYIFRFFNTLSTNTNYNELRLRSGENVPLVAFRDLSNEDEEVYIKQLCWCAWTLSTKDTGADIEVDFLDEVDYFDSLSIRILPPYVLA